MLNILRSPRLALLVLVLGLAGCADLKYEPVANNAAGYDPNPTGNDSAGY